MNRNLTHLARDRRTARPVFRSFLDGIVLLALTAILLTVQVTPVDDLAAASDRNDLQPVQASLFPSIISTADRAPAARPVNDEAEATACNRLEQLELELEILQDDTEVLVIVVRRGDGPAADIIPTVVRPEV